MPQSTASIITLSSAINFGAALQAYALRRAIAETRTRSDIIDYGPKVPDHAHYVSGRTLTKPAKFALYALQLRERREQARRFNEFQKNLLSLSRPYPDLSSLQELTNESDVLVCGSDQIWNPRLPFDPVYFLQFGSQSCRRVAYAPSFGTPDVQPHLFSELQKYLGLIDILSCREKSGVDLMEKLTGRQVFHAVDPTLLLESDKWKDLASKAEQTNIPEKYILVYSLQDSSLLADAVNMAHRKSNLPIVAISAGLRRPNHRFNHLVRSAGPLEFLSLIMKADTVVTNSMHGTIFSLIFEKPAFFPQHTTSGERVKDLLSRLGIMNNMPIVTVSERESAQLRPVRDSLAAASLRFLQEAVGGHLGQAYAK